MKEVVRMKEEKTEVSRGRKKAYIFDDSCALCGSQPVETGRIFHGHCVCETCVDYILNIPAGDPDKTDQEKTA